MKTTGEGLVSEPLAVVVPVSIAPRESRRLHRMHAVDGVEDDNLRGVLHMIEWTVCHVDSTESSILWRLLRLGYLLRIIHGPAGYKERHLHR